MEAEDYKTLLKQAEDELGATPGAYCSRKAALRALELLRAAGQQEFSKVDERITEHRKTIDQYANRCAEQARVIERQAQAIRWLEEENTKSKLEQGRDPQNPFPKDGLMLAAQRELERQRAMQRPTSPLRDFISPYFDNAKQF